VINELFARGAEVMYNSVGDLHVSGHACQEELKIITALTKPEYLIPVHGETRHLKTHCMVAKQSGFDPSHVIISENGKVIELTKKSCRFNGTVPAGDIMVDDLGVGDVGSVVLRDRKHLAQDGNDRGAHELQQRRRRAYFRPRN
jgi:ribonuclease J